jgi:hypothetical protein
MPQASRDVTLFDPSATPRRIPRFLRRGARELTQSLAGMLRHRSRLELVEFFVPERAP